VPQASQPLPPGQLSGGGFGHGPIEFAGQAIEVIITELELLTPASIQIQDFCFRYFLCRRLPKPTAAGPIVGWRFGHGPIEFAGQAIESLSQSLNCITPASIICRIFAFDNFLCRRLPSQLPPGQLSDGGFGHGPIEFAGQAIEVTITEL